MSDSRGPRERAYDEHFSPLVAQLIALSKRRLGRRLNRELDNKSLGMETQQTEPFAIDLDTFDLAGCRKEMREVAARLLGTAPAREDWRRLAELTQIIDAWIDNLPSELKEAGDRLVQLSDGQMLLLCDLHIQHFEKMIAAGKRGNTSIRIFECEGYLGIWKSAKEKIEKESKKTNPKPIRELLLPMEQAEFDDALASGEYDDELAEHEDK